MIVDVNTEVLEDQGRRTYFSLEVRRRLRGGGDTSDKSWNLETQPGESGEDLELKQGVQGCRGAVEKGALGSKHARVKIGKLAQCSVSLNPKQLSTPQD